MRIEQLVSFDDERAHRWYAAFRDGAAAGREAPLITSRETQLASLAADATNPNRHREAWGVGESLASSPGGRFALARGYVTKHVESRLMLDLPDKSAMPDSAVGYQTFSFDGPMPAEWLAPLADLVNGMEADVPTGELDVEAASWDAFRLQANQHRMCSLGYTLVTTVIVNEGGEAVAYTQMLVSGGEAHQEDTYVRPADRGHRLGTVAKARNLRALADWHPFARRVHTWTAEINDPMRRINEAFGFRPMERMYALEARLDPRAE
jgi:hypothetical protein